MLVPHRTRRPGAVSGLSETFGPQQYRCRARVPLRSPAGVFGGAALRPVMRSPYPMSLAVAATVFAVIFFAELPDKTALASLVLGSRYRPSYVFAGVAAAFTVHAALAVAAGTL